MSATDITTNYNEWNPANNKYTPAKINKSGGKAITILNPKSNRSLHITTPPMMTWGISDFVDQLTQESDGKYTISLNFPNSDYSNADSDLFLKKLKEFESQVIDDAVKNSDAWWGEPMSKEILKHTFFPFLKYQKDKITKKVDPTKPPSIRAKVSNFDGKWPNLEIYDTRSQLLFPCENPMSSPMDFVPKMSNVMCLLQCGGIWIGGKGWGITWKLVQCVVKPRENVSVLGRCRILMTNDTRELLDGQDVDSESLPEPVEINTDSRSKYTIESTSMIENSDDDEPVVAVAKPSSNDEVEKVVEEEEVVQEKKNAPLFKKPVPKSTTTTSEESAAAPKVVKKIVKKVTTK